MDGDLNLGQAALSGPDGLSEKAPTSALSALPQILDLTCAKPLRDSLVSQMSQRTVILEAGAVERMSTPCAQVLLAAGRASASGNASFKIVNASAAFREAVVDLGLGPEFSKWMD